VGERNQNLKFKNDNKTETKAGAFVFSGHNAVADVTASGCTVDVFLAIKF